MKYPNLYLTALMMTYSGGSWNVPEKDFEARCQVFPEAQLQAAEDYCANLTVPQKEYLAVPEDPETDDFCEGVIRGMAEDNPAAAILNNLYGV